MPTFIGLDVGRHSIKAVVVDGTAKNPRIRDFFVTPRPDEVPGETEAEKLEFLVREFFLEHRRLGRSNVIVAIGEGASVVRQFTVDFTREEQIRGTIHFAAEPHFHLLTMAEVVLQYYRTAVEENRSKIYAAVAKKRELRQTLDVFQKVGIDPVMIDLSLAALANAVQPCLLLENNNGNDAADENEEEPVEAEPPSELFRIVMDLGDSAARYLIFRKNSFYGSRVFQTRLPSGAEKEAAYVKKIVGEVTRTMATLPPGGKLTGVALTGGLSLRESIVSGLKDALDIPVEMLDLASGFRLSIPEDGLAELNALGPVAVGLAAKGVGRDLLGFDYRQAEFRYVKKFDKVKKGLACTACLLFVIIFLWTYATQLKLTKKRNELRVAEKKLTEVFSVLLPGEEKEWKDKKSFATFRKLVRKRQTGETIGFPTTVSALDYINTFFKCLYDAKKPWKWESGAFSEKGVTVKGRVKTNQHAAYVKQILDLNGKKYFSSTRMDSKMRPGQEFEYGVNYRIVTTIQESRRR
jgi:hypothetical protein